MCPAKIVVQTDWFPEAEHGATYELVGDDYVVDVEKKTVTGFLRASDGSDTGIDIEVRTGGPAIGFSPVSSQLYTDTSITMGFVSNDDAINAFASAPTIAIMAPLEKNPQVILWDPETYPDVKSIADLVAAGVTMNVFAGQVYMEVFVKEGKVPADLVDPSYDGSPARFISEGGKIAQQGFASAEPYQYENEFTDWGKPLSYQYISDAGFNLYSQPLAIRAADKETLAPCLTELVPIMQQAAVDFVNDPARTNAIIIDAVAKFNDFWVYGQGVADYSAMVQKRDGLVGNGPDSTLGNFDLERVQTVIDQMLAAGFEAPADLKAEQIVTNEFIDPAVGL